jgi:putative isomerase
MKHANAASSATQEKVDRRSFVAGLAGLSLMCAAPHRMAPQPCWEIAPDPDSRQLSSLLRKLLVADDSRLYEFATEVYAACVLGKIRPPDPPLADAWVVPGGGYYAQWLWDTMFVVDLLALLPGQAELIRGVFQNYWDFQKRWDQVKPESQHGMIANFIAPFDAPPIRSGKEWKTVPAYSQAPLLAWGMERVYRRNGDKQLLCDGLTPLESFHEWYWRERDVTNIGLIGVGAYSGDPQYARYETYDQEVDLDGLKMTPHPGRPPGVKNGSWYGDILIPANTSYLLASEQSLARMAGILGDHAMAARRQERYRRGAAAMRRYMWSQPQGCFLAIRRETLEQIAAPTVGGFMPMFARAASPEQSATMARTLATPAWATPLPIPTVARTNKAFVSSAFWRGDVWPAPNYQVASGLAASGQQQAAAHIADRTVANALHAGISERYDSLTGEPLGVQGLGMSATVLTMMLDGLTSSRYNLRVRHTSQRAAIQEPRG